MMRRSTAAARQDEPERLLRRRLLDQPRPVHEIHGERAQQEPVARLRVAPPVPEQRDERLPEEPEKARPPTSRGAWSQELARDLRVRPRPRWRRSWKPVYIAPLRNTMTAGVCAMIRRSFDRGAATDVLEVEVDLPLDVVDALVVAQRHLRQPGDPGEHALPVDGTRRAPRSSSAKILGCSGRGPTMFMSPLSTLKSWGSSSSRVLRRNRPTGVIRGSSLAAHTWLPAWWIAHRAELVDREDLPALVGLGGDSLAARAPVAAAPVEPDAGLLVDRGAREVSFTSAAIRSIRGAVRTTAEERDGDVRARQARSRALVR